MPNYINTNEYLNRRKLHTFILILVSPTTTKQQENSFSKQTIKENQNLIRSHDWYQNENQIILSIYTKRKGMNLISRL